MEELIRLLLEETENEDRSMWYSSGCDVQVAALGALKSVLERVQYRLNDLKEV